MKIVKANAVLLDNATLSPYQCIERAGRTCYKSEDKITDDSAVKFVKGMFKSGHTAMCEHGTIYLRMSDMLIRLFKEWLDRIKCDKKINDVVTPYIHITGNYVSASFRVFANMMDIYFKSNYASVVLEALYMALSKAYPDVFSGDRAVNANDKYTAEITVFPNKTAFADDVKNTFGSDSDGVLKKHLVISIIFTTDRGVSHEIVRHRPCGFAQESTRYCNYSKDKFGNEITVIEPCFWPDHDSIQYRMWKNSCEQSENSYFELTAAGATPQEARSVLPNSLKTEIVVTATEAEWQHMINLRWLGTTGAPHPQAKECFGLAVPSLVKESEGRIVTEVQK